jgi:hypothetical protein
MKVFSSTDEKARRDIIDRKLYSKNMLREKTICPCKKNGYSKDTEKGIGMKFQRKQTYEITLVL